MHVRIRNFLWRLGKNILSTWSNLEKKGMKPDPSYPLCHENPETIQHIFLDCPYTKMVWFSSLWIFEFPRILIPTCGWNMVSIWKTFLGSNCCAQSCGKSRRPGTNVSLRTKWLHLIKWTSVLWSMSWSTIDQILSWAKKGRGVTVVSLLVAFMIVI